MTADYHALLAERFGDPADDLRPKPPRKAPGFVATRPDDFALLRALERTEEERALRKRRSRAVP